MKLNNQSKIILAMVAVVFIVFNVIFFLFADTVGINATTIVSWVFMILGFVSFMVFSYLSASKQGVHTYVFLRFTLLGHCTIYLIVDFILAIFFTILASFIEIPILISITVQIIALGIHIFIALSCLMTKTLIENVGAEVKQRTSKIKGLRVEAEMLVEYCTDANAKNDFRKFAEAMRYSDPMSCDALTDVEANLEEIIAEMKEHLIAGEVEAAQDKCKIANNILKERNRKCMLLK